MKETILTFLPGEHPWAEHIHCFPELASTNDTCKALALSGAPEGTVVIADRQSAGRGRMGRSFHSPAGMGLYFSLLLRPDCKAGELMHLTCAVAAAAAQAIEQAAQIPCGIKWTNDLVFDRKKLGGILTELSLTADGKVDFAILGIGINCCHLAEDFPVELRSMAASLSGITGRTISREKVAAALIRQLHAMAQTLHTGKDAMLRQYKARCVTLGQDISLLRGETLRHGHAVDLDAQGGLVVLFPDGHLETVTSGEVSVRGMYGYI